MRNKIIAALVAGGLLVGAGLLTSVVSTPDTAVAQEETADQERGVIARGLAFLGDVLDELVGDGTIDSAQANVILEAVEQKAVEIKEEHQALREEIKAAIEDGVLTEAEAAVLPEDHWLLSDALDEAWADGELTIEELREARPHPRLRAFKHGARFGALLDDGGIDQSEYDELADNHPRLAEIDVSEYLGDDGVITPEELREIWQNFRQQDGDGA